MLGDQHQVDLKLDLPVREVLRLMDGVHRKPVRPAILELANRLLGDSVPCFQARGIYSVCNVARMTDTEIELDQGLLFRGAIMKFLGPARRVAIYVATIGQTIEQLAGQRWLAGDTLEGYTLHAIGSAAADAASDALVEHLWSCEAGPNEAITPLCHPGFCGLPIEGQATLFSAIDTRPIGVTLLPSMMMRPLKSVSGLVGIGWAQDVEAHGIPCEYCQLQDCHMHRKYVPPETN